MSSASGSPSGREYGRVIFVCGCALALVLSAAVLPLLTATSATAPIESLFPTHQGSSGGPGGGGLGALNPGAKTTVGGLESGNTSGALRSQSAEVHFVVQSTEPTYWRTGAYETYTGSGWKRSTDTTDYGGKLRAGGLVDQTVSYRVTLNRSASALPTVWRPQRIDVDGSVEITEQRAVRVDDPLAAGTTYTATSATPPRDRAILAAAGTDYPSEIEERYTQLPTGSMARLDGFTDELTADADSPYETAKLIEQWLETNKTYSLNVDRPDGDHIASDFVFEMERGYCEYFATSMVVMLRTQGIPARYVVGYSTGQQTGEDTYTVRGMNAHAWVEVYFPDVGWVRFDPTPGQARLNAERSALQRQQPDAGSYNHTEQGSPGESFAPSDPENNTQQTPTDDPLTPQTPITPPDENETDPPDDPPDDPADTETGYNITLSDRPIPGSNVTVIVKRDGRTIPGVTVLFNGESIGKTDEYGTVDGQVPYSDSLTVSVVEPGATGSDSTADRPLSTGGSGADRQYALEPLTLPAIENATTGGENSSRSFELPTNATLSLSGTIATDQTVVLTTTIAGKPVPDAVVTLDGERIGTTDDAGRLELTLPDEPGTVNLTATRGTVSGNRTIHLRELTLDVKSQLPVALPWTGVTVTAKLGNESVAGIPVSMNGERIGTTGINGTVTATLPLADSATLSISEYGQRADATVGGLWLNLGLLVGALTSVLMGGVVVARRRDLSAGAMVDQLVAGILSLPGRLVGLLIAAADALVRLGTWLTDSVRRGIAALRAYISGEYSRAELLGMFRTWLNETVAGVRSAVDPRRSKPEAEETGGDAQPESYLTIREAWRTFLTAVSVRDPETKTPGELAAHAVERDGLPRGAVERLRDAFRDVEYGATAPDERQQAVERAADRIEQTRQDRTGGETHAEGDTTHHVTAEGDD